MQELDRYLEAYLPTSPTAIENNLIMHWYPQRILNRIGGRCRSLLELGLGHGFTAEIFNQVTDRHVIVEGSNSVILEFKRRRPDFPCEITLDLFETYEAEETFDVIIMGFILEHVDKPAAILQKYRRFLNPGGKLFVAVPNAKSLNRRMGLAMGKIDDIYALNDNDLALGHQRQYCPALLAQELTAQGYAIMHQEGIYLKPLPLQILKTIPEFEANLQAMLEVGIDYPDLCVAMLMEAAPAAQ